VTAPKNKAQKRRDPKVQKGLPIDSALQFEELLKDISVIERYSLRLFVTGTTTRSRRPSPTSGHFAKNTCPAGMNLKSLTFINNRARRLMSRSSPPPP